MPQATSTTLLRGGLDVVSPPLAVPTGRASAAVNYEPEATGYRRIGGFERFDGRPSPSTGADAVARAALRAAIGSVPGAGPVRGVWVYDGTVWAFRDTVSGSSAMYKATASGWEQQSFGRLVNYTAGTAEFVEGENLVGFTSTAVARIERVVLRSGTFAGGNASGYLVVSDVGGTFGAEIATSDSGSATINGSQAISIVAGGRYDFITHNFYGATKRPRMYFANGVGTAFEWDGEVLSPIVTGNLAGALDNVIQLLHRGGGNIRLRDGSRIVMRGQNDIPRYIGQFRNHLFLSFDAGSVIHSGIGEPLDYRAVAGASEISFGSPVTGFLPSASASFVIFGRSRVDYLTGNDVSDFVLSPISDRSGALPFTAQMAGEAPAYLDDGGVRKLGTTSAFGDWRMGTLTYLSQPLFQAKAAAGVAPVASIVARAKDQYHLFFADRTGIIMYLGRKEPETMPFIFPVTVSCSCSGEPDTTAGERYFIGAEDGYVYELDRGTSFDGAAVQSFIRLPWANIGAPSQEKRFHKATIDMDAPSDMTLRVQFHVDFNIPGNVRGERVDYPVAAGSQSVVPILEYDAIDFTVPTQARVDAHIDGIGRNIAVLLSSEQTDEEPHTLSAMTLNYTPRRILR